MQILHAVTSVIMVDAVKVGSARRGHQISAPLTDSVTAIVESYHHWDTDRHEVLRRYVFNLNPGMNDKISINKEVRDMILMRRVIWDISDLTFLW